VPTSLNSDNANYILYYEGAFMNGSIMGYGKMYWKNGDEYTGYFEEGLVCRRGREEGGRREEEGGREREEKRKRKRITKELS
jgi:hypothetical protein